jgi:1,4-dihydroxy-2-naphthoyl-CoA synthase
MSDNPFDPSLWRAVDGFDLTDITYHRHVVDGKPQPTVRVAFDRPEVRNAFRPHTVDELYRVLDHARMSSDVGVGLLEPGVLAARHGQVAHDVQGVPATGRPPVHDGDDDLGHGADQPLHLEDVQPPALDRDPGRVHRLAALTVRVLVAGTAPNALVTAGTEGSAAVLGARAVAGDQDGPDVR